MLGHRLEFRVLEKLIKVSLISHNTGLVFAD